MSSQNVGTTLVYMAYNTSTGAYTTGDALNHTLKLVKDGTEASPTNSPSEVDSTNTPGAYKLTLTAAETQFGTVWLGGKSSTSNVIIIPITVTFEILPTALSGSNVKADAQAINAVSTSSVTTVNANVGTTQPINFTGTAGAALVKTDVTDIATVAVSTSTAQLGVNVVNIAGSAAALDANNRLKVDVDDWNGTTVGALPGNFSFLSINGSGAVSTQSNVKKNTAQSNFLFVMTNSTTHVPQSGLTVAATRSLDGASFAPCANAVSEVGNGTYQINLAATDTNANHIMLRFTASSSDDLNIELITVP